MILVWVFQSTISHELGKCNERLTTYTLPFPDWPNNEWHPEMQLNMYCSKRKYQFAHGGDWCDHFSSASWFNYVAAILPYTTICVYLHYLCKHSRREWSYVLDIRWFDSLVIWSPSTLGVGSCHGVSSDFFKNYVPINLRLKICQSSNEIYKTCRFRK